MDSFAPPSGPPPPKVPEGWKAVWNDQYHEWFFVNIYTKKSTWDKPTQPVYASSDEVPAGPPPNYNNYPGSNSSQSPYPNDTKSNPYDPQPPNVESDAALAARLQAEENARVSSSTGSRNAMQDYQNTSMSPGSSMSPAPYSQEPPRDQKKGFLGKLLGKASSSSSGQQYHPQQYPPEPQYGQPQYQQQQYPPQQQQYGGGYGGGYSGGYGGGGYQQQQQPAKKSGGIGTAGALALGAGGGLVGGMLLEDAIQDHDQNEYQQGFDAGQDDNGGGDWGGDDGGDF